MLKIENIDFSYGASKILFQLSMLANEGSVTCILGRNGVGKSTLLKTIMGIEKSNSGDILLNDLKIQKYTPAQRARNGIAYVPQGREIFPLLTVEENLQTGYSVLKRNDRVISDEIYEQLCYDDIKHVSLASIEGMKDHCVVINGFSKSHSMTGYRIGYAAAPIHVAKAMSKLQSQITSCASSVSQAASIAALSVPDTWIDDRVIELQSKRDLAYNLLQEIDGITCVKPSGAFYLLPDISSYFGKMLYTDSSEGGSGIVIDSSLTMCLELLRVYNVALVPGEAFGAPNTLRISYAASTSLIKTALSKFKQFLERLEN